MILRAPTGSGSTENVSLGRNNTPMDGNGPLLARMGNAGPNGRTSGGPAAFNANRNGPAGGGGGAAAGGRAGGFRAGEQDIILSPQIRSFNMGCQLPPASVTFPGPGNGSAGGGPGAGGLLGDSAASNDGGNTASAGRRIGSGRIMSRDERLSTGRDSGVGGGGGGGWNSDYKSGRDGGGGGGGGGGREGNDNYGDMDGEYHRGGRGGGGGGEGRNNNGPGGGMNKQNTRFFRMNDRRDGGMLNDPDGGGGHRGGGGGGGTERGGYNNNYRNNTNYGDNGERGGGRGGGYHRNHRYEREEPEWFTGGPCSQLDTIELHGFDGPAADEKAEGGADGGGSKKLKRVNEVEKELKSKEEADQANERRRRGGKDNENAETGAAKGGKTLKDNESDRKNSKDTFEFGQEEESALRKMVPTGSSPIKKAGGGQMDMRHFEDFLRLEDLLSVSRPLIHRRQNCISTDY